MNGYLKQPITPCAAPSPLSLGQLSRWHHLLVTLLLRYGLRNQPGLTRKHMAIQVEMWQVAVWKHNSRQGNRIKPHYPRRSCNVVWEGNVAELALGCCAAQGPERGAAAASLLSPTTPHTQEGLGHKGGCQGLSVTVFISLLLSPQRRVRRICCNQITEMLAAWPLESPWAPLGTDTLMRTVNIGVKLAPAY